MALMWTTITSYRETAEWRRMQVLSIASSIVLVMLVRRGALSKTMIAVGATLSQRPRIQSCKRTKIGVTMQLS